MPFTRPAGRVAELGALGHFILFMPFFRVLMRVTANDGSAILDGNIDAASRVELLQTGVLNGELKAGSLTVAAGSRMRGKAEFGWDEKAKH